MSRDGGMLDPVELLRREQALVSPPEGAEERVLAALLRGQGSAFAASLAAAPSALGSGAAEATGSVFSRLARRFVGWSLLPLAAGFAMGFQARSLVESRPLPAPATNGVPLAAPAISAPGPTVSSPPVEPSPVDVQEASSKAHPAPAKSSGSDALLRERRILDRARQKLAAGEPEKALAFLQEHAQSFRQGTLSEEREAMMVNVLVSLGRTEQARARGEAFRARFPGSLMQKAVDAALDANQEAR